MRDMEYIGQMKELKRAQFHLTRCARQLEQARERDTPTRPVVIAGIGSALIGISDLD